MNKGNGTAETMAPPDVLNTTNVFDNLDLIRRDTTDLLNEKGVDLALPVRKPRPREHFRVCDNPSMSMNLAVYVHRPEGAMEEQVFFVMPGIEEYLRSLEELRFVQLVLCRSLTGALFLWPLPINDADGAAPARISTARDTAREALTKWVRMKWRKADGCYFMLVAEGTHAEPQWPDKPFNELLKLAFKDRVIDSRDHPVMQELRGIKQAAMAEAKAIGWLA